MSQAPDLPIVPAVPTDAELRDSALAELRQTTVGYLNKHWPPPPPEGTHWAAALGYLDRIGQPAPAPPASSSVWAWDATAAPIDLSASVSDLIANCLEGVTLSCSEAQIVTTPGSMGYVIASSSPYSQFDPLVYITAGGQPNDTGDYDGHLTILDAAHERETNMEHGAYGPGGWSCGEGNSFALDAVTCPAEGAVAAACTPLSRGIITPSDLTSPTAPTRTLQFSMDVTKIGSRAIVYPGNPAGQPGNGPSGNLGFGGWTALLGAPQPPAGLFASDPASHFAWRCLVANGMILRDGGSNVDLYGLDVQGSNPEAWAAVGVKLTGYAIGLSAQIPWHMLVALRPPAP